MRPLQDRTDQWPKCWKDMQISDRQTSSTILKYNCRLKIKADQTWTPNMKLKHGLCPFEFMETGLWACHWLLCTQYIFSFWNCCDYQHNWFFGWSLYTRLRSVHIWFDRYSGCVNVKKRGYLGLIYVCYNKNYEGDIYIHFGTEKNRQMDVVPWQLCWVSHALKRSKNVIVSCK